MWKIFWSDRIVFGTWYEYFSAGYVGTLRNTSPRCCLSMERCEPHLLVCIWPSTFDYKFQFRFDVIGRWRIIMVLELRGGCSVLWRSSAIAESSTHRPTGSCPPSWKSPGVRDRVWKRITVKPGKLSKFHVRIWMPVVSLWMESRICWLALWHFVCERSEELHTT